MIRNDFSNQRAVSLNFTNIFSLHLDTHETMDIIFVSERILNYHNSDMRHQGHHLHKMHQSRFSSLHPDYYLYNHTYHEDGRIVWSNVSKQNACLLMNDLPVGQHVVGLIPRGPKHFSLTHLIVVK